MPQVAASLILGINPDRAIIKIQEIGKTLLFALMKWKKSLKFYVKGKDCSGTTGISAKNSLFLW